MDLEEQENKKDLEGDLKEELGVEQEEKKEIVEGSWATTPSIRTPNCMPQRPLYLKTCPYH